MLNSNKLKNEIEKAIKSTVVRAIKAMELEQLPPGSLSEKIANDKAQTFDDMVTKKLAEALANAIDCYVKNAEITGNFLTNGSPTTHAGIIVPASSPLMAGKTPNTLGIK